MKGLVTPAYDGLSIANLMPTVLQGIGVRSRGSIPGEFFDYSVFAGAKHVVLLCLDGLGYAAARDLKMEGIPLTSVAPSTTTAAWPSIFTGLTPLQHGITGFWVYLRELEAVTTMTRFGPSMGMGSFVDEGIDPTIFFPFPTLHQKARAAGYAPSVVIKAEYKDSGLSQMIHHGADLVGYRSLTELFAKAKALSHRKTLLTLYWDDIDMRSHIHGPNSRACRGDIARVRGQLETFLDRVKDTLVLVVADHGQLTCPPRKHIDYADHPELLSKLTVPPNGEGRFSYLFVKKGREDKAADYVRHAFGKKALLLPSAEALPLLGRGKPFPETKHRIGTFVLIPTSNHVFTYPYLEGRGLLGFHGGLSREEMLVPLLWART